MIFYHSWSVSNKPSNLYHLLICVLSSTTATLANSIRLSIDKPSPLEGFRWPDIQQLCFIRSHTLRSQPLSVKWSSENPFTHSKPSEFKIQNWTMIQPREAAYQGVLCQTNQHIIQSWQKAVSTPWQRFLRCNLRLHFVPRNTVSPEALHSIYSKDNASAGRDVTNFADGKNSARRTT